MQIVRTRKTQIATNKQRVFMDKLGIKYNYYTTYHEARIMISKALQKRAKGFIQYSDKE